MLGHLVLGRYAAANETPAGAGREAGWMTKLFRAVFRKRS